MCSTKLLSTSPANTSKWKRRVSVSSRLNWRLFPASGGSPVLLGFSGVDWWLNSPELARPKNVAQFTKEKEKKPDLVESLRSGRLSLETFSTVQALKSAIASYSTASWKSQEYECVFAHFHCFYFGFNTHYLQTSWSTLHPRTSWKKKTHSEQSSKLWCPKYRLNEPGKAENQPSMDGKLRIHIEGKERQRRVQS